MKPTTAKPTVTELLLKYRETRSSKDFEAFYMATRKYIAHEMCENAARCPNDHEDLIQDTYVRVITSIQDYDADRETTPMRWLMQLAKNSRNHLFRYAMASTRGGPGSRNKVAEPFKRVGYENYVDDNATTAEEVAMASERKEDVLIALTELDENDAIIAHHRFGLGRTRREIVHDFGFSISKIRRAEERIRPQLREMLSNHGQ